MAARGWWKLTAKGVVLSPEKRDLRYCWRSLRLLWVLKSSWSCITSNLFINVLSICLVPLAGITEENNTFVGNFENEALENEDRSTQTSKTKHPKLENEAPWIENEAPITRKRRPLNLENEVPKTRKRSTLDRKRSTQKLDTGLSFINTRPMLIQQESSTITNRMQFKSTQVVNAFPPLRGRPGGGPCGFRPFDFDSKLKIENQKFTIVISNVWFLKNWKSQIYNLNRQFLFLRNIKLKNNFQCFENQKLKIENGQLVVFISCF